MKILSKKAQAVLVLMQAGAYWRHALEKDDYTGREQFKTRLRDANGYVIKGYGFQTRQEMMDAYLLVRRDCPRSSVWPTEHELATNQMQVAA